MVTEITVAAPVLIAVVARLVETADEGKDGGVDGVAEKYDHALKERLEIIRFQEKERKHALVQEIK